MNVHTCKYCTIITRIFILFGDMADSGPISFHHYTGGGFSYYLVYKTLIAAEVVNNEPTSFRLLVGTGFLS